MVKKLTAEQVVSVMLDKNRWKNEEWEWMNGYIRKFYPPPNSTDNIIEVLYTYATNWAMYRWSIGNDLYTSITRGMTDVCKAYLQKGKDK